MSERLRIAVAGAGSIGRDHIDRVRASADCELVGIADPAPLSQVFAARLGVAHAGELGQLLDAVRPDGVILATPNVLHVEGALACIARGMAVLIEKPVADTLADAMLLAEAAERSGVPVLVGQHRRYSAVLETAQAAIRSGVLGTLVAVQGSAVFHKPAAYFEAAPHRRQRGAGPILTNMVHEIDNLRLLAGEIVEVQAIASNARRGFEVEDTACIGLRFANGALGSFMLSDVAASTRSWEQTSGENPAYARDPGDACYLLSGERGTLAVPTLRLQTVDAEPSWFDAMRVRTLECTLADPLVRQLEHFCVVIRRIAVPRVSVRDAAQSLRVTLAIVEAAESGGRVACGSA